jgi:hypothetical protein
LLLLAMVVLQKSPGASGTSEIVAGRAVLSYSLELPGGTIVHQATAECPSSFPSEAIPCRLSGEIPYYKAPFNRIQFVLERTASADLRLSIGGPEPYDWFPGGAMIWTGTAQSLADGLVIELWLRPNSQHRHLPRAGNGDLSGLLTVRLDLES